MLTTKPKRKIKPIISLLDQDTAPTLGSATVPLEHYFKLTKIVINNKDYLLDEHNLVWTQQPPLVVGRLSVSSDKKEIKFFKLCPETCSWKIDD
jgi:hypothetical protein